MGTSTECILLEGGALRVREVELYILYNLEKSVIANLCNVGTPDR